MNSDSILGFIFFVPFLFSNTFCLLSSEFPGIQYLIEA